MTVESHTVTGDAREWAFIVTVGTEDCHDGVEWSVITGLETAKQR